MLPRPIAISAFVKFVIIKFIEIRFIIIGGRSAIKVLTSGPIIDVIAKLELPTRSKLVQIEVEPKQFVNVANAIKLQLELAIVGQQLIVKIELEKQLIDGLIANQIVIVVASAIVDVAVEQPIANAITSELVAKERLVDELVSAIVTKMLQKFLLGLRNSQPKSQLVDFLDNVINKLVN